MSAWPRSSTKSASPAARAALGRQPHELEIAAQARRRPAARRPPAGFAGACARAPGAAAARSPRSKGAWAWGGRRAASPPCGRSAGSRRGAGPPPRPTRARRTGARREGRACRARARAPRRARKRAGSPARIRAGQSGRAGAARAGAAPALRGGKRSRMPAGRGWLAAHGHALERGWRAGPAAGGFEGLMAARALAPLLRRSDLVVRPVEPSRNGTVSASGDRVVPALDDRERLAQRGAIRSTVSERPLNCTVRVVTMLAETNLIARAQSGEASCPRGAHRAAYGPRRAPTASLPRLGRRSEGPPADDAAHRSCGASLRFAATRASRPGFFG